MKLGVHVSTAGGKIYETVDRAVKLGCNTMQFFSRNPQQWRAASLDPQDAAEFRRRKESAGIAPVFVHIPYLINLASPNPRLYKLSVQAYIEDIRETDALGAEYLVTHMGSHKETTETGGIKRLTRALRKILAATEKTGVGILLENTAGSGSWLGYTFSHQRKVLEGLGAHPRIGFCLDTAHAFLAGYELSAAAGLEKLSADIEKQIGWERLKLVHLNDAKGACGSHLDRHDHIGKGGIGAEGMRRIINHPRLRTVPFILETPKDTPEDDPRNLELVRRMRK